MARLQPYLGATHGHVKDALRLYQWNVELSGAVYEALHVFEVVLRNAIDGPLCVWNAGQVDRAGRAHGTDWLLDPAHLLGRLAGDDIRKATRFATRALRTVANPDPQPVHGDVLAQPSFATWRYLLPDRDPGRQRLWHDAVHAAFPHLARPVPDLVDSVEHIYRLRNRVAHLEPLLHTATVSRQLAGMRKVLAEIDPHAEQWLTSRQRVSTVLRQRPSPPAGLALKP